jgi:sialate O-acetylesterase
VYKEKVAYSGPVFQSAKSEGNQMVLSFQHTEGGLKTQDGADLKGFAIAGADKKFYWATASVKGNTVVVSSKSVPHPVAVRYAWANNPTCNLTNETGLPAVPFRTDDWQGITFNKR